MGSAHCALFSGGLLIAAAACGSSESKAPGPTPQTQSTSSSSTNEAKETGPMDGFLEQYAATNRFRLGRPGQVHLLDGGRHALFLRSEARSFTQSLYAFSAADGEERVLLTAESLLAGAEETLSVEERARRERARSTARGISTFDVSKDGTKVLIPLSGRIFLWARDAAVAGLVGTARELEVGGGGVIDPQLSPDGSKLAFVRNGELFVHELDSGATRRVSEAARENISHGTAEFVAQEEMGRSEGYWWSPDSSVLAYQSTDESGVEKLRVADPMHPEADPDAFAYPRAGKANAKVTLSLVSATGGARREVGWDHAGFPYLARVVWDEVGPLTLVVQARSQREARVLRVDPATGATVTLLEARDNAWLNIDTTVPRWIDGERFLWSTEETGAWTLQVRTAGGAIERTLIDGSLGYSGVLAVDRARGQIWFEASADPREQHAYVLSLAAGAAPARRITTEPGLHNLKVDHESGAFHDAFDGPEAAQRNSIVLADGSTRHVLRSVAESPPFPIRAEQVTVGERGMHALVLRPRGAVAGKKYPVVVHVYGGPGVLQVTSSTRGYALDQWMADHGVIVVNIDGRGTPGRGRAWERAIVGNLADIALEDQEAGLRALGAKYPEMDLSRVGIFGWSFGGYLSAMAVLRRPETFHVAVAGAPVTDWTDYDTHYTERYLGLPSENAAGYARSSALLDAAALRAPLLIVHGTADDNVYFLHALKLSNALFRSGRDHELLPLAGLTHMVPDPTVTVRMQEKVIRFLLRGLGVTQAPSGSRPLGAP